MVCSKKRKMIEEVPQGVHLNTWMKAVQEAAFVLGMIETDKVTLPRARKTKNQLSVCLMVCLIAPRRSV